MNVYHLPVRPYSPIDALNRKAAALGSAGYARATHRADYNGHHVTVSWNDYRKYYVARYRWSGDVVIARGTAEACVAAAIANYNQGALGASVEVTLSDSDTARVVQMFPQLVPGKCLFAHECEWHTWRHDCARRAVRDNATPSLPWMVFDWSLMQAAADQRAYEAALTERYGRTHNR
jgi:hypothetical protein